MRDQRHADADLRLVANYFRTNVRGAAVAWCAGFGRLGGVGGPLLGGLLVAAAWR